MNRRENVAATLACGLAGDVVRTFGEVRLRVFGTSMAPSILPGDLISVQRAGVSEISSGEIVLYIRDGRMFVHRVVACAGSPEQPFAAQCESLLITRGDRLRHNDPPVSSSELLGKVISIERDNFQRQPAVCLSGWERLIARLLRRSDHATYLYLRLAAFWGSFVGRTFRSDNEIGSGEGLLSPEASGAKARNLLTMNVGAEAPTHKSGASSDASSDGTPDGTFDARLRTPETQGAAKCRA